MLRTTPCPEDPIYAWRKIAVHYSLKYSPEASVFVHRDFYIDDGETSMSTLCSEYALIGEKQVTVWRGLQVS